MVVNIHLSTTDLAILLACLEEVRITSHTKEQQALFLRLSKSFQRKEPEMYRNLVTAGAFQGIREYTIDHVI